MKSVNSEDRPLYEKHELSKSYPLVAFFALYERFGR
jgi:hypothetical protein